MLNKSPGLVSVVIVNFRGVEDTIECVTRLGEVRWPTEKLEIIVVENGSGDDSLSRLKTAFASSPNVRVIESAENLGFTGGSNLGAKNAKGEFVAFLNNDAKPDPEWISAALTEFHNSPSIAAVGSKVLDWDGKAVDFVKGSMTWFGMGYKDHVTEIDEGQFDKANDMLFGTGSALFVRAEIFEEVGGFDEGLFMFYDDVDLGWRLNLLGYRVRYAPKSIVFHKHHGSMRSFGPHREMYLLERNALHLLYKNLSDENLGKLLPGALSLLARRAVSKSGLDSEMFDIRRFTGAADEFEETTPINKETLAGLFALDQFVEDLPELQKARNKIQAARQRTDKELFGLFGDAFKPLFDHPDFLTGLDNIVDAFDISQLAEKKNVLVITGDSIGEKMAGPAMRAWKISEVLSKQNNVRLITWNVANRASTEFDVIRVPLHNEREMKKHEEWADVIFFQGHAMHHFRSIKNTKKVMVVDLYDPIHLEQLEQGREWGTEQWRAQVNSATDVLNEQLIRGDFFLCASERQRMFWLGQLAALGRINPDTYSADENLRSLIDVAPFGMDASTPVHTRNAIRGVVPGIGEDDKVIIWGGGLYNWFDTLTLVRAVAQLAERRPNVRLFFLGVKHPNPDVPEMAIVGKTRELASRLGVAGKNVFFNEAWVALDDRHNYLLESDVGVSTHYDHIETTFSFRTRILDYMWANLPIVTTRGDSFGDLVESEGMGVSVSERNVDELADALEKMLYDDDAVAAARSQVARVREQFTWDKAMQPLARFCLEPVIAPDRWDEPAAQSQGVEARKRPRGPQQASHFGGHPPGLSRDVALARHYIKNGGVGLLSRKVLERLRVVSPK